VQPTFLAALCSERLISFDLFQIIFFIVFFAAYPFGAGIFFQFSAHPVFKM
jgi:hypothetical protein